MEHCWRTKRAFSWISLKECTSVRSTFTPHTLKEREKEPEPRRSNQASQAFKLPSFLSSVLSSVSLRAYCISGESLGLWALHECSSCKVSQSDLSKKDLCPAVGLYTVVNPARGLCLAEPHWGLFQEVGFFTCKRSGLPSCPGKRRRPGGGSRVL